MMTENEMSEFEDAMEDGSILILPNKVQAALISSYMETIDADIEAANIKIKEALKKHETVS